MKLLPLTVPLAVGLFVSQVALAQYAEQPATGAYGSAPATAQPTIESGGLAPPPSTTTETPEVVATESKLDEAKTKDSGRGLEWVWLNAEFGFEHLGLQTFSANKLVDANVVGTTQTGLMYGVGAGVRLVFITLGARFRIATLSAFDIWTLNGEAGLRIPLGKLEPHLSLGGGFASIGAFSASDLGGVERDHVAITGYDLRAGGGLDYYVTPIFSVGASVTFEVLGLTRPGVGLQDLKNVATSGSQGTTEAELYKASGSSVGSAFTGALVLGLHF
ncbi:MAG TPA: hypothetical protein VH062_22320 [Polyangiaceae bacterium]|jgi:hypothetical protein|nr:hypothetical protein [Polyangiaceae bacterium]